jgi:hypothetical protein
MSSVVSDLWGQPMVEKSPRWRWGRGRDPEKKRAASNAYQKRHQPKIAVRRKGYFLKRKFGISEDAWNKRFRDQERKCAICKTSDFGKKGPQTDHCHSTGKVRGILCAPCNRALGVFKDNIELLQTAIKYLAEAKSK